MVRQEGGGSQVAECWMLFPQYYTTRVMLCSLSQDPKGLSAAPIRVHIPSAVKQTSNKISNVTCTLYKNNSLFQVFTKSKHLEDVHIASVPHPRHIFRLRLVLHHVTCTDKLMCVCLSFRRVPTTTWFWQMSWKSPWRTRSSPIYPSRLELAFTTMSYLYVLFTVYILWHNDNNRNCEMKKCIYVAPHRKIITVLCNIQSSIKNISHIFSR